MGLPRYMNTATSYISVADLLQAFGFTAALLESLPIIGLVFTVSNRVGAAMWAHGKLCTLMVKIDLYFKKISRKDSILLQKNVYVDILIL